MDAFYLWATPVAALVDGAPGIPPDYADLEFHDRVDAQMQGDDCIVLAWMDSDARQRVVALYFRNRIARHIYISEWVRALGGRIDDDTGRIGSTNIFIVEDEATEGYEEPGLE